jgi:hypothetical protein
MAIIFAKSVNWRSLSESERYQSRRHCKSKRDLGNEQRPSRIGRRHDSGKRIMLLPVSEGGMNLKISNINKLIETLGIKALSGRK